VCCPRPDQFGVIIDFRLMRLLAETGDRIGVV
jgi:hypothetical protein